MQEEEEEELENRAPTRLEPIEEVNEPKEDAAVQTETLEPQNDNLERQDVFVETVEPEMEPDIMDTHMELFPEPETEPDILPISDDFDVPIGGEDDYDFNFAFLRRFPSTPPPTPRDFFEYIYEEKLVSDKGKSVSIPQDVSIMMIPTCAEIKKEEEERALAERRVMGYIDETLEKPGLRVATLDPDTVEKRAECITYAGVERFAAHFVDTIIDQSVDIIDSNSYVYSDVAMSTVDEGSVLALPLDYDYMKIYDTYIKWPSIAEFTRDVGRSAIDDYVQGWEFSENWLYCVDFLMEQSDDCSDFYLYDVKWSIPTKQYPIPQATASVYFTIQVCRVKPSHCSVDVTYNFEASRLIHTPGKIQFQEKWLFDIIDAKIELFKKIKF